MDFSTQTASSPPFLQATIETGSTDPSQPTHPLDTQADLHRHHFSNLLVDAVSPELLLLWRRASIFCKAPFEKIRFQRFVGHQSLQLRNLLPQFTPLGSVPAILRRLRIGSGSLNALVNAFARLQSFAAETPRAPAGNTAHVPAAPVLRNLRLVLDKGLVDDQLRRGRGLRQRLPLFDLPFQRSEPQWTRRAELKCPR